MVKFDSKRALQLASCYKSTRLTESRIKISKIFAEYKQALAGHGSNSSHSSSLELFFRPSLNLFQLSLYRGSHLSPPSGPLKLSLVLSQKLFQAFVGTFKLYIPWAPVGTKKKQESMSSDALCRDPGHLVLVSFGFIFTRCPYLTRDVVSNLFVASCFVLSLFCGYLPSDLPQNP